MRTPLDQAMAKARLTGDWSQVIALYTQAADTAPDAQATAFYLTHAYVHALEAAAPEAPALHTRLTALGADTPHPANSAAPPFPVP